MGQNYYGLFTKIKRKPLGTNSLAGLIILVLFTAGFFSNLVAQTVIVHDAVLKIDNSLIFRSENLVLKSQGSIKLDSGSTIQVSNIFANNSGQATDLGSGTMMFVGDGNSVLIGDGSTRFENIKVAKSNSNFEVALRSDIKVDGSIYMQKGDIDLGDYSIDLGTTGAIVGESNQNRIKATNGMAEGFGSGYIVAIREIEAGENQNLAGLGLDVFSNNYLGSKTIMRYGKIIDGENYFTADTCAYRTFFIPSLGHQNNSRNVDVKFFSEELFSCIGGQSEKPSEYSAYLLTFDSRKTGTDVNLEWKVYGIMNMESFEIEASNDNVNYLSLGSYFDLGLEESINSFSFDDNVSGYIGQFKYYRLKQNINSSDAKYYGPLAIDLGSAQNFKPYFTSQQTLGIETEVAIEGSYNLQVFNALSQPVVNIKTYLHAGRNTLSINLPELPDGIYIVKLAGEQIVFSEKLVKTLK